MVRGPLVACIDRSRYTLAFEAADLLSVGKGSRAEIWQTVPM